MTLGSRVALVSEYISLSFVTGPSRDGEPPLPEPDGGPAGVSVHNPGQADAAVVPGATCL